MSLRRWPSCAELAGPLCSHDLFIDEQGTREPWRQDNARRVLAMARTGRPVKRLRTRRRSSDNRPAEAAAREPPWRDNAEPDAGRLSFQTGPRSCAISWRGDHRAPVRSSRATNRYHGRHSFAMQFWRNSTNRSVRDADRWQPLTRFGETPHRGECARSTKRPSFLRRVQYRRGMKHRLLHPCADRPTNSPAHSPILHSQRARL